MNIQLVEEFFGTFGTKYFLEIITQANTSKVEISETVFERIKREQDFRNFPNSVKNPMPEKVIICNERKVWRQD